MKLIRLFFVTLLFMYTSAAYTQDFEINSYKAEVGLIGGNSFYLGDANSILFSQMNTTYGGFFRYNFNTRISLRAEIIRTTVSGTGNIFNDNSLNAGDVTAEFNFFDLERNPYRRYSKSFSPYIFGGIGIFTDMYAKQFENIPNFISIPFGFGLKLKLGHRLNANVQWSGRLSMLSDNMEDNATFDNPNGLNGTNIFNNDFLSTITLGISYDIWKKKCDCLNINSKK